ncbi:hypothetical protein HK098_002355 [Nowakowskiella sp. JEL0407]|nr:hypothetical protein HK098_002355 [Nowakowskiella sp. JEL0407]
MKKLKFLSKKKLYSEISKRPNESNMFADFLGTLGESPDIEHFINTAPTTSGATAMIQRKTIANFFRNCTSNETLPNLRVLVLNLSHTYSLGSMSDYLFTLCENKYFRWELGIQNAASSGMKVAKSIKHKLKRSLRPATMGRENFSHTFQREIRFPQINGIAKAADSANLSIQSETNCAEEWEPASEAAAVIAESSYLISCKIQGHEPPNYGILQPQKFPWAPKRAQTAPILSNNKIEVNLPTEHRKFIVGQSSILEKCTVDLRTESLLQKTADKETIQIGSYCIVSDCDLKIPSIFQNFAYPDGLCLFLTKVSNGHVPIFFGTSVNIKQDHLQLSELYLIDNVPLSFFIRIWETLVSQEVVNQYHKLSILLEEESKGIKRDMDDSLEQDSFSIYTLQLFPVFREATEAREFALNSIESISRFLALEQIERSEILGDNEKLRQEYSVENKEFLQLISLADAIKNAVLS